MERTGRISTDQGVCLAVDSSALHPYDASVARNLAIVFGGSGFIGRHLLTDLRCRGSDVVSIDLRPLEPHIDGVRAVLADVRDKLSRDLIPVDLRGRTADVYNLAAVHRTPGHADREYYDTNVSGALNITELCRELDVRSLVFTSSISIYGPAEEAKDETHAPHPESAYGASKLQAEGIHRVWQRERPERKLVIARPAVIFGEGERGNFTRLARALRRRRFVYPGRRDTIKACGYVKELVASFRFALEQRDPLFLYNFCYAEPYTIEQICDAYHRVGGLPRPLGTVPSSPLRGVAHAFEWLERVGVDTGIRRERIDKLVRSTHITPRKLLDSGYQFTTNLDSAIEHWSTETQGRFE